MTNNNSNGNNIQDNNAPWANSTQIRGALDRVFLVAFTWLASKGYITTADVGNYVTLAAGIAVPIYAFYINRNKALAQQASTIPNTTVITTPEIAAATPEQKNIVSNVTVEAVRK